MVSDKKGLYQKYVITKTNGQPVDPKAKYFVLRYDKHDEFGQYSRRALFEFAKWAQRNPEFKELADDLLWEIADISSEIYKGMIVDGKMQRFFDGVQ